MKYTAVLLAAAIFCFSCKSKKKEEPSRSYISISNLLKKEVENVDTSLFSIIKVVSTDSLHHDTTFIPREKFAEVAKDFLELPDFSNPDVAKRFNQEMRFDSLMDRGFFTYTPVDPKSEEIIKVELLFSSETLANGDNRVTNIIIDMGKTDRNGAYSKKMLWTMGKKFLITYITQKPAEPEKITVTKVTWNDDDFR